MDVSADAGSTRAGVVGHINQLTPDIAMHNLTYKRNRSNSASRRKEPEPERQRMMQPTSSTRNNLTSDSLNSRPSTAGSKKNGPLLSSFKGIMNKNPFKNFTKKKTIDKKEEVGSYTCECNKDKKLKKLQYESTTGCVRSMGWLRNKYMPQAAHEELKKYFDSKKAEKPVTATTKDQITKDVVRTFNANKFMAQPAVKERFQSLLECVALTYPHTGYVQGMNYIAGTLLYHCDEYLSLGVIKILFEQLELKDVFLPSRLYLTRLAWTRPARQSH